MFPFRDATASPFIQLFNPDFALGQPESPVEARAPLPCVSGYDDYHYDLNEVVCIFKPATSDFLLVQIIISKGIIHQIDFLILDNTLRVGDLEMLLGKTNIKANPHEIVFSWHGNTAVASIHAVIGPLSLFHPVWMIAFMDT